MKAKEWLHRGAATEDPFDRFSNLWRGFNNLYANNNGGTERDNIRRFIVSNITEETASNIMAANNDNVAYLVRRPVNDMRGNGRTTQQYITEHAEADSALGELQAVAMVVYQIRCNFEHGQKSPNREEDQRLCRHSSIIVERILEQST